MEWENGELSLQTDDELINAFNLLTASILNTPNDRDLEPYEDFSRRVNDLGERLYGRMGMLFLREISVEEPLKLSGEDSELLVQCARTAELKTAYALGAFTTLVFTTLEQLESDEISMDFKARLNERLEFFGKTISLILESGLKSRGFATELIHVSDIDRM